MKVRINWIDQEFNTLDFGSKKLEKRFKITMSDLSEHPDKSILLSSGSRSQAKAVYRMISNEKCTKAEILSTHRDASASRSSEEPVLLAIQDTMSVNYAGHTPARLSADRQAGRRKGWV
jgi:muramidase (phage lysozyme)